MSHPGIDETEKLPDEGRTTDLTTWPQELREKILEASGGKMPTWPMVDFEGYDTARRNED